MKRHTKSLWSYFQKKIKECDRLYLAIRPGKGDIMLGLKDNQEMDDYSYKVCGISSCENEAFEIYETNNKIIDVCEQHEKMLNANKWTLW